MRFAGFDPAALALLDALPAMTANEYAAHKHELRVGVVEPGLALICELADRLDADLAVSPRSSVSPLHRDLRFAPEGAARYKDHLLLTTWEGREKKTSPTLWLRVDAKGVGYASGVAFTPHVRERWRSAVGGDAGSSLASLVTRLARDRGAEVAGDQVKRVPPPFPADHPRADLLRRTGFQVRFAEPLSDAAATPAFADHCLERLSELLAVHRWLVANATDVRTGAA